MYWMLETSLFYHLLDRLLTSLMNPAWIILHELKTTASNTTSFISSTVATTRRKSVSSDSPNWTYRLNSSNRSICVLTIRIPVANAPACTIRDTTKDEVWESVHLKRIEKYNWILTNGAISLEDVPRLFHSERLPFIKLRRQSTKPPTNSKSCSMD